MKDTEGDIDLVDLILVLWSEKLLIAGFALLFGALAAAFAWTRPVAYEIRVPIMVRLDVLSMLSADFLRPASLAAGPTWQVTEDKTGAIPFYATSRVPDMSAVKGRVEDLKASVEAFEKEWIDLARLRLQKFSTDVPIAGQDTLYVLLAYVPWRDQVALYDAGVDLMAALEPGTSGYGSVRTLGYRVGPAVGAGAVAGFLIGCFVGLFRRAVRSRRMQAAA